ncbi:MAG: glutamine synthetase family protein [Lachnospiraceae bacterium]|nr:glutamine synthetase family protein [Lachnospiraceae bacterium]
MNYTMQEIKQFVEEEDVKFIRLAFTDIYGTLRNVSIMPSELDRAFREGISIDAWSVPGFGGYNRSDLFLHPDPSTLSILPWRPEHGRVVRMYSNITWLNNEPFENDCRAYLKKAVEDARQKGYTFRFGTEQEFYLFKQDMEGESTGEPYDNAGYMDIAPEDRGENIRREICITLEQMGITPESSHHEEGPGQNEIDFRFCEALKAADDAVTFRSVVRTIASRNGATADFSPKPIQGNPGNGMHINMSVRKGESEAPLEPVIAAILEKIPELTLFFNPVENSYERLGYLKAPGFVTWGRENRSVLVRLPAANGEYKRLELRSPDTMANPYLAFGLLIYAGLYGLTNSLTPPPVTDKNLHLLDEAEKKAYTKLPASIEEAARAARDSEFLKEVLPENIRKSYVEKILP